MYTESDLVRIAKRENNKKRSYLVVNRLQGKHMPVKPHLALELFDALAEKIRESYPGERLFLVGFAETATAIGAAAAVSLDSAYIQTTREDIPGAEYLFFSEAHSHATEQRLVKNDLDAQLRQSDRIIFVEDEVTTGNTIMNIVNIIKREYGETIRFSVASILNGMGKESLETYEKQDIDLLYLVKTDHSAYEAAAEQYESDGVHVNACSDGMKPGAYKELFCTGAVNARRLVTGGAVKESCGQLWEQIKAAQAFTPGERVLVLGTEEFMFPALYAAAEIEKEGCEVRFHATTRSPIAVSREEEYPLHSRFELRSLYDAQRVTYLYDLKVCDRVLVLTDAPKGDEAGIASLICALEHCGNRDITVIRWEDR